MLTKNNNEMRIILPNINIYYYNIKNGMVLDTRIDRSVEKSRNLKIPVYVYTCVEIVISSTSISGDQNKWIDPCR